MHTPKKKQRHQVPECDIDVYQELGDSSHTPTTWPPCQLRKKRVQRANKRQVVLSKPRNVELKNMKFNSVNIPSIEHLPWPANR